MRGGTNRAINGVALLFVGGVASVIGFRFGLGWLGWPGAALFVGSLMWLILAKEPVTVRRVRDESGDRGD